MVGADAEKFADGTLAAGSGVHAGSNIGVDSAGNVTSVTDGAFVFSSNSAPLVESSTTVLAHDDGSQQKITWGRWEVKSSANTFVVMNGGNTKNSIGSFHFIRADQMTPAVNLTAANMGMTTAVYSAIGGSTPTSEIFGESGHLDSLQATVDFTQQKITAYQLKVSFADRSFKGSGGGIGLAPTFTLPLIGDCQGCSSANPGAPIPVSGQANGAFIGPKAEGMITSFGMQTTLRDRFISGTALGKR